MVAVPWPINSAPGVRPNESAGRLINAYSEPLQPGARAANVIRRAPGLASAFTGFSQTGNRGNFLGGTVVYSAWSSNSGKVTTVDSAGTVTTITNTVPGTKKVTWARNQNAVPQLIVVDPDNGSYSIIAGVAAAYNSGGTLPQPNSVCFLDGYMFFTLGDNRCFATGLNTTVINALAFITCQGKSNNSLVRAVPFTDLYLCGTGSIEVWADTAETAPAFPFSRVKVIPRGVLNGRAITGFEEGFGKGIVFVGDDGCVYVLNGYSPYKISTPDVDRAIAGLTTTQQASLELFSYIAGGHACIAVTAPTFTWVYDSDTMRWHERQSYALTYWRASKTVNAFGMWLAGDSATGTLLKITDQAKDEVGSPSLFTVESGPVNDFPHRLGVPQATFDIAAGVGQSVGTLSTTVTGTASGTGGAVLLAVASTALMTSGDTILVANVGGTTEANGAWNGTIVDSTHILLNGTLYVNAYTTGGTATDVTEPDNVQNPHCEISWSDDGGLNWSTPLIRALGAQDVYAPIKVAKTGMTKNTGRRWRVVVADAVDVELTAADMLPEVRAA